MNDEHDQNASSAQGGDVAERRRVLPTSGTTYPSAPLRIDPHDVGDQRDVDWPHPEVEDLHVALVVRFASSEGADLAIHWPRAQPRPRFIDRDQVPTEWTQVELGGRLYPLAIRCQDARVVELSWLDPLA